MFNYHQIAFKMSSPVCFYDRPCFDSLVVYCHLREEHGDIRRDLNTATENLDEFPGLPIEYHPDGYPIASLMMFDKTECLEDIQRVKKRWCSKHDALSDFGKAKRRIDTGKGHFKSFDLPLPLYHIDTVYFYFKGDADKVKYLIDKHLRGIGKKTAIGYGEFSSYKIQDAHERIFEDMLLRPIPVEYACFSRQFQTTPHHIRYCGYRPSYYKPENMKKCVYPNL